MLLPYTRLKRFRWVFCQLEVLRHCFPNNLRRILEELPKSLDETYKRILREINDSNQKQAHQLLQCLALSRRPLRVEELAEVLALHVNAEGIPEFDANWRWEDHETAVLSACSSFVSVIIDDGSRIVQFSHFSVKEFLTSDRLADCIEDISQFYIAVEPSHAILPQACLGALLHLDECPLEDRVKNNSLFGYAVQYWDDHAKVGNVELQMKKALDYFFDLDNPYFTVIYDPEFSYGYLTVSSDDEPTGVISPEIPLYLAARLGLHGLAERLIAKLPQAIDFRGPAGTPLHISVQEGHMNVIKLLLAHGADINSLAADNSTPLHIALQQGHLEIANLLLNSGAEVNSQEQSGLTPLHLAAYKGRLDIFHILLERNADVHVHNRGDTALLLAASGGHFEIARILLECNVEVNSQSDQGFTPFLGASWSGNLDIVRLLLERNANVHVHDDSGNTPLHLAASKGHLQLSCMLLGRSAEVNSRNYKGSTPLHKASKGKQQGKPDIVRLLLDCGADVQVRDDSGNTPLHFAVLEGHLELACILLENNAEVNSRNHDGLTPFYEVSWEGNTDIMWLLLDNGADVHTHHDHRNTPLHRAVSRGHLKVARILVLELNSDVNSPNIWGSTPLHTAINDSEHEGISDDVRLLVDNGADVHAHDDNGHTPLYLAAYRGHLEVTRIA